jgi:hypothetical protein
MAGLGMKALVRTTREEFAAKHPGAAILVHENPDGAVMLAVAPQRLVFTVEGTITSDHIVGVLRDAREAGLLPNDEFSALADFSNFAGVFDWKIIPQISEVMPKGDSVTNKNAYVVRNTMFMILAKINAALFPKTQHAAFTTETEARAWLGWE